MIRKIWNLEEMEIKIENLKKVIPPFIVEAELKYYSYLADNRLDVLYLTYYNLKDRYLKIDRRAYGKINNVDYTPKTVDDLWSRLTSYASYPTNSMSYAVYNNVDSVSTLTTALNNASYNYVIDYDSIFRSY